MYFSSQLLNVIIDGISYSYSDRKYTSVNIKFDMCTPEDLQQPTNLER